MSPNPANEKHIARLKRIWLKMRKLGLRETDFAFLAEFFREEGRKEKLLCEEINQHELKKN
jgi:hypothetical protein